MPNAGDFDPAEAIRQQRAAEEAEKQRVEAEKQRREAQEDLRRANALKLLRYADAQLENIPNPVVSEFVITERWHSKEGIFRKRTISHQGEQARYYGLSLALNSTRSTHRDCMSGLVKLRQPRAGYAFVKIDSDDRDCDPRTVSYFDMPLTNYHGEKVSSPQAMNFRILASLEEAIESIVAGGSTLSQAFIKSKSVMTLDEKLTRTVTQALDFVATGRPPEPEIIPYDY